MKKILTISTITIFLSLYFLTPVFSCGMKKMRMRGGMEYHHPAVERDISQTSVKYTDNSSLREPASLIEERCNFCHTSRRIYLSRKPEWSFTINRMERYAMMQNVDLLTDDEKVTITDFLNTYYSTDY